MDHLELNKIIEAITKPYLDKIVDLESKLVASKKKEQQAFRSEEIKDLAIALAKAQAEYDVADLNRQNPYFKSRYADLMSVVQASRPALTKHGLSVLQDVIHQEDGGMMLFTILLHSSGQYVESRIRIIPPKNDIQSISSYTTYIKRLAYSSLLGVVTGEDDDDGEKAVAEHRETFAKGVAINTKYNPKENPAEVVSKEQLEELEYELADYPDIAEKVLDGLHLQNLADMPKSKYMSSLTRIREIKMVREGKK